MIKDLNGNKYKEIIPMRMYESRMFWKTSKWMKKGIENKMKEQEDKGPKIDGWLLRTMATFKFDDYTDSFNERHHTHSVLLKDDNHFKRIYNIIWRRGLNYELNTTATYNEFGQAICRINITKRFIPLMIQYIRKKKLQRVLKLNA